MAKKTTKSSVGLGYPPQYILSFMANRYAIEREDGFTVAHFGLVNRSNLLLDRFTCIFSEHTLKSQRENLVQYSDKVGLPKKKTPTWVPPFKEAEAAVAVPVIDFLHLCHWDDAHAEICFWNFSQAHLSDLARMGKDQVLTPWGVAMLRCEIDLQRGFLADLYNDRV